MKKKAIIIFALAIFMIGVGIYQNQPQDVWRKAEKICLECVGIG